MKSFCLMPSIRCVFYLSFFLAVLIAVARGQSCNSQSECPQDECCLAIVFPIRRCKAKLGEGNRCSPKPIKSPFRDAYLFSCPCLEGLSCVPEDIITNKEESIVKYFNATCKPQEDLLKLYKRLLEGRKFHPRFLTSVLQLKNNDD